MQKLIATLAALLLVTVVCHVSVAATAVPTTSDSHPLRPIVASTEDKYLRDDLGRVQLFHGVNFIRKSPPWYDARLMNATMAKSLAAAGVRVIRLGIMWSGVEPQPDQFNHTYIRTVGEIVDVFAQAGVYTLLDMHQDVLSQRFCTYDGFPSWLIDRSRARKAFPWPYQGNCSMRGWSSNYLTEAASQAFEDTYSNVNGMRDSFVKFWQVVATQFANSSILGYELINEPFAGDVFKDPTLFLPGEAGRKNLQPLYDAIAPAIRAHDKTHLIFYEPVTWGMVLDAKALGSGFSHPPGGQQYANLSVFAFHYYCWFLDGPITDPSALTRAECDRFLGPLVFDTVDSDVAKLKGSSFLTEFGATTCDIGKKEAFECLHVTMEAEQHWQSWIHWPTDEDWPNEIYNLTVYRQLGLSRPYPRAVAGMPVNFTSILDPLSQSNTNTASDAHHSTLKQNVVEMNDVLLRSFSAAFDLPPDAVAGHRATRVHRPYRADAPQPQFNATIELCFVPSPSSRHHNNEAAADQTEMFLDFEHYFPQGMTFLHPPNVNVAAKADDNVVIITVADEDSQAADACVRVLGNP